MKYAASRRITKFRNSSGHGVSTHELRTCDTKTADDTNEPFPIDTETLKDVVRGGACAPQERMRVGIVSGSEQATYYDISYLWEYTRST